MDTLTRRAALIMVGSDLAARVGDRTAADRDQVDVRVLRARRALGRLLDAELLEVPALARAQAAFGGSSPLSVGGA